MKIQVKLFAILRDRAGCDQLALDLSRGATAQSAAQKLAKQFPAIDELLPRVAFAINREYARGDVVLHEGDELALIPPVSGG